MSACTLRYKYDFMRFPMENPSNYELVVRSQKDPNHAYDVYIFQFEPYTDCASLLYYYVDLKQYSQEELTSCLKCWGYSSLKEFQSYLEKETSIRNYELRLATCITENDSFIQFETLIDDNYDTCFDYLVTRLDGRSPLDDTDDETSDEPRSQGLHDIGF